MLSKPFEGVVKEGGKVTGVKSEGEVFLSFVTIYFVVESCI